MASALKGIDIFLIAAYTWIRFIYIFTSFLKNLQARFTHTNDRISAEGKYIFLSKYLGKGLFIDRLN